MRLAFVSDTHFGYPRYEEDALVQGTGAILDACSRADVLLLGGDIFDHRIPKLEVLAQVAMLLQKANSILDSKERESRSLPQSPQNQISQSASPHSFPKILGIHGTHEARSKDSLNPIAMMAKLGLMEDVHNKTIVIENNNKKIAISGMGGIPDDLVKEGFSRLFCKPEKDATNFFLFHQTLSEYVPAAKNLASIEDLPSGYDYYLCGHIHARKEYLGGKLLIPGSTVMTQMKDEETCQKGYYLFDTSARSWEFIPIPTRPFFASELKFENSKSYEVREKVSEELAAILAKPFSAKPIIKIRLVGSLAPGSGELDLSGIDTDMAFLTIDNQLDGNSLLGELERLKGERMLRSTPLELGMSLLRENAKKAGLDEKKAQGFFERFTKD